MDTGQWQTGKDERRNQAENDQVSFANEHGRAPLSILTGELCHKKAQKAQKAQTNKAQGRTTSNSMRYRKSFMYPLCVFVAFVGKMASRQKERVLTSPKTSTLAFISVLPWRINDGQDTNGHRPEVGCSKLVKPLRGCDKSFSTSHKSEQLS